MTKEVCLQAGRHSLSPHKLSLKPASDDRQSWPTFWAWFSFRRQSADEIVEPWHVSLVTSRLWRQKMADDKDADAFMLL